MLAFIKPLTFILLLVSAVSVRAEQFYAYADVSDTVTTATALPALLLQQGDEDAQLKLEYHRGQLLKQLENSSSMSQLLQRLLLLQKLSSAYPAVREFLQTDVFALAAAQWQHTSTCTVQSRCRNIAFLHHNPFIFTALDQLPLAYTYVNAVLSLAAPLPAALAAYDLSHAVTTILTISEPLAFFSSLTLLRRVLIYYGQPLTEFDRTVGQHSSDMLRRTTIAQTLIIALTTAASWKLGLKKLLRRQALPKRLLPLLVPLSLSYLVTEKTVASQREKWQQTVHYSEQILLLLMQE